MDAKTEKQLSFLYLQLQEAADSIEQARNARVSSIDSLLVELAAEVETIAEDLIQLFPVLADQEKLPF
jgi:glutaredoxin 2